MRPMTFDLFGSFAVGWRLDETCECPHNFPIVLLLAQLLALAACPGSFLCWQQVIAILLWPSIFKTLPKPTLEHFLAFSKSCEE